MRSWALALLLVAAHAGGAQSAAPTAAAAELARRLAGCYRLDDGAWRADSVRAGDVSTEHTPLFFELTDELLRGWEPLQSRERPLYAVREPTGLLTYWQRVDTASAAIHVSYPMPLAGISLTLAPDGRDLVGSVEAFTDAIERDKPSEVTRPVRARRIDCAPLRPLQHATRSSGRSR